MTELDLGNWPLLSALQADDADAVGVLADSRIDADVARHVLADLQPQETGATLRVARRRLTAAIARRNLAAADDGWATLAALSDVADVLVVAALDAAHEQVKARHGQIVDAHGQTARLGVLALGKLGGNELNFSSDIDVIFVFDGRGDSDGDKPLDAANYFARVAQRAIALLADRTEHGFGYRVDTRLRPFGRSGPIAISAAALETYYEAHGRDWERYALVKSRALGDGVPWMTGLLERLRPFVYRRYLDFSALAALRDIKREIAADVARRGGAFDLKRGRGGIREAEFIVQVLQLVHGGGNPALRTSSWRRATDAAQDAGDLDTDDARRLTAAYLFLRQLENRIQMWADDQTHRLPEDAEQRQQLAAAFGCEDWSHLMTALESHCHAVNTMFHDVVGDAESGDDPPSGEPDWAEPDTDASLARLRAAGVSNAPAIAARIRDLQQHAMHSSAARPRLARIWSTCVESLAQHGQPDTLAHRLLDILDALLGRTTYLALLDERPVALEHLIRLAGASDWLAQRIGHTPGLLDELLDPRLLGAPPDRAMLVELAEQAMDRAEGDEARLDALRWFQRGQMLRVAAAEISGALPLMKVSDHLSWIAEVTMIQALEASRAEMAERHGQLPEGAGLAVVAYGKLGGIELNYGSDLDLVFLYQGTGESDGARPLDVSQYAIRWAQRMIHWVSTQTGAGRAYEIDTRLRPSGRSGLLVSSLKAFEQYQRDRAWTWEHQALCRARAVAGDPDLCAAFDRVRATTLAQPREDASLRDDVVTMRERLRREWLKPEGQQFDIKQSPGGLMDVEFLVQFLVLRHAHAHPEVARWSDNVRQLETMGAEAVLAADVANGLRDAYLTLRSRMHATALAGQPAQVDPATVADAADRVRAQWQAVLA